MKTNRTGMRVFLLSLFATLLPLWASAQVEIDGIWYNLVSKAKTAEVTSNPNWLTKYSGDITIPATVIYEDVEYDVIVGAESRGFIFGAPIAYKNNKPLVLARKKGKLPCETVEASYELEYGTATIELHKDSIKPGQRVVIIDDLIATGGTTEAMIQLVEQLGGEVVGVVVLMELAGLEGRKKIEGYRLDAAIVYPGK